MMKPLAGGRRVPVFAAIPAKNEENDIGACLQALSDQRGARLDGVVLCLNNCTDGSAKVVRFMQQFLALPVHVLEVALPLERACAGVARRIAMDHAAELAGPDGVVLTTDADGRVAPDWLAANLRALHAGADAVAGQADIEPEGAALIPSHLHAIDARECAYAALLDEIRVLLDPDPVDPWPRHDEHSGASIAVTVAAYRLAGGMPAIRLAEDRAFFEALRRVDARIRHDRAVRVTVSARTVGRAQGGMADTIRRRMDVVDEFIDDRLEPVADAMRRARSRARLHGAWLGDAANIDALSRALRVDVRAFLPLPYFGLMWSRLEETSPVLQRHRVALHNLAGQTARAKRIVRMLRDEQQFTAAADPVDNLLSEAAE